MRTVFLASLSVSLALLAGSASALQTRQGPEVLHFNVDYACFRYDDEQLYVEIYYDIPRNQLQFELEDSVRVARFDIEGAIFKEDSLIHTYQWTGQSVLADSARRNDLLFTTTNFLLPPGHYRYVTTLHEPATGKAGKQTFTLDLSSIDTDSLTVSDIELAYAISLDTSQTAFTKNQYRVIPNASRIYSLQTPVLYFYAEIYNLSEQPDSNYAVEYTILNSDGSVYRSYPEKVRKKPGTSLVEVGAVNVVTFPRGTYELQLKVHDAGDGAMATARKKFFVYREEAAPPPVAERPAGVSHALYTQLQDAPLKQLNEEFDSAAFMASEEERQLFRTLDLEAKRTFMMQFWAKRDFDPQTARNEARQQHVARMHYANQHFGGVKKGWKSDRGRVLLEYGEPDEIERHPSSGDVRPYEIWRYFDIEGGVLFVFVDRTGLSDLELVHSDARGEIYDPDWERWVRVQ